MAIAPSAAYTQLTPSRPNDSVNDGSLPVVIHAAIRQDMNSPRQNGSGANRGVPIGYSGLSES